MAPASSLSATGTLPLRLTGLGNSEAPPASAPVTAAAAAVSAPSPVSAGPSTQGFTLWQRPPAVAAPPRPAVNNMRAQPEPVADLSLGPAKQSPLSQLTGLGARPGGVGAGVPNNNNHGTSLETLSAEGLVTQWKAHVKQMAALLVQRDSGDPASRPAINQQLNAVAMAAVGRAALSRSQSCTRSQQTPASSSAAVGDLHQMLRGCALIMWCPVRQACAHTAHASRPLCRRATCACGRPSTTRTRCTGCSRRAWRRAATTRRTGRTSRPGRGCWCGTATSTLTFPCRCPN